MLLEFLVYVRLGNLAIWVRNVSDAGSFDSDSCRTFHVLISRQVKDTTVTRSVRLNANPVS